MSYTPWCKLIKSKYETWEKIKQELFLSLWRSIPSKLIHCSFVFSRTSHLSHSGFREVPANLRATIRDIRLTGNKLDHLNNRSLSNYTALAVLVLDDCGLRTIAPDTFTHTPGLQRLWLNANRLQTVPAHLPSSLKGLYLEENNIKSIERADFDRLEDLEELHLQRNQISVVEAGAFTSQLRLTALDLRANRLDTLNVPVFPAVNSLSRLDLSMNPLRTIGRDFLVGLRTVKQLEMSRVNGVAVEMPEEGFVWLGHLTSLDLSGSPVLARQFLHEVYKPELHQ